MTEINSWVTKERTKKGTTLHDRTAQWTVWKSVESFGRPISETGFMIISLRKRCFFLDSQHKCWQYLGLPLHLSLNWLNCWYFLKFIARKTGLNREIDWSLRNHGLPITLFWAEQSSIDICPGRKFIPLVDAKKLLYTILLRAISIIWIEFYLSHNLHNSNNITSHKMNDRCLSNKIISNPFRAIVYSWKKHKSQHIDQPNCDGFICQVTVQGLKQLSKLRSPTKLSTFNGSMPAHFRA